LRFAFAGLAIFLALPMSVALWSGEYFAATLGMLASVAIGIRWAWKWRMGIRRGPLIGHASILLTSLLTGMGVSQYVRAEHVRASRTVGIAPFEIADRGLRNEQADHSNSLRLKLSAVLARAGLSVMPDLTFDDSSIDAWSFDSWRARKMKEIGPHLLLRSSMDRCQASNYKWWVEPYENGTEMLSPVDVSGSDKRILSVQMAFKILTQKPLLTELDATAKQATRRIIVEDIYTFAASQGRVAEAEKAQRLLLKSPIADDEVRELLKSFEPDGQPCRATAAANSGALKVRLESLSQSALPPPAAAESAPQPAAATDAASPPPPVTEPAPPPPEAVPTL